MIAYVNGAEMTEIETTFNIHDRRMNDFLKQLRLSESLELEHNPQKLELHRQDEDKQD